MTVDIDMGGSTRTVDAKPAWMWVHPMMPYNIGYPGMVAELFFSSPEV